MRHDDPGDHAGARIAFRRPEASTALPLFHITSESAWREALDAGTYAADSLATEGFIHCSEQHQVAWVANQRFRGRQDLVLLRIDSARLTAEVIRENLEGGEQLFPHVYGAIPTDAVVQVLPFRPGPDGRFSL